MLKFPKQYMIVGLAGLCFAASLAVPFLVYTRIHRALSYVSQVKGDLLQEGTKETKERLAHQLTIQTAQQRAQLSSMSVGKNDAAGFIGKVESSARAAGVALDIGQVTLGTPSGGLQILSMQVAAEGTETATTRFLQLLETLPQAATVPAASLENRGKMWMLRVDLQTPIQI